MDTYDLTINKGETYNLTLTLKDSNGLPIDLSNSVVSGFMKFRYSDTGKLVNLNPVIDSAPSGIISISMDAAATASLPVTLAPYDIEILNTGTNVVTKALMGKGYIYPEVTF